jgi:Iron-containing redox enzyme
LSTTAIDRPTSTAALASASALVAPLAAPHTLQTGAPALPANTVALLTLREELITHHPVNDLMRNSSRAMLQFFELYGHFAYGFAPFVCTLFTTLRGQRAKAFIYENLLDEMGCVSGQATAWDNQHGELYRSFLTTLRRTDVYQSHIGEKEQRELDVMSKRLADQAYGTYYELVAEGNDAQSVGAFSGVEGWVAAEYPFWRACLASLGNDMRFVDMRTIEIHCEADVEHARVLDELIGEYAGGVQAADVHRGLLRGIEISQTLFAAMRDVMSREA